MKALAAIFDIVPGWVYAILLAGALAAAGVAQTRFLNERTNHAIAVSVFESRVADAEAATRAQSEKNRATEQELRNAQDQNAQQAEALLAAVDYAVTVDRVASQRLRDAAEDLAAVARSRCAASPAVSGSEAGDDPIGVLADVLGRADRRAGELAAIADESRIRGLTCEAEYSRAREALAG